MPRWNSPELLDFHTYCIRSEFCKISSLSIILKKFLIFGKLSLGNSYRKDSDKKVCSIFSAILPHSYIDSYVSLTRSDHLFFKVLYTQSTRSFRQFTDFELRFLLPAFIVMVRDHPPPMTCFEPVRLMVGLAQSRSGLVRQDVWPSLTFTPENYDIRMYIDSLN